MRERQGGFTLIELLVVILIIAILAAIAIPAFFQQRLKGWEAQQQSSLRNAAIAVESYAGDNNGDYSGIDGLTADDAADPLAVTLASYGFIWADYYTDPSVGWMKFEGNAAQFCINVRHKLLTSDSGWRRATYHSSIGAPKETPDACPNY